MTKTTYAWHKSDKNSRFSAPLVAATGAIPPKLTHSVTQSPSVCRVSSKSMQFTMRYTIKRQKRSLQYQYRGVNGRFSCIWRPQRRQAYNESRTRLYMPTYGCNAVGLYSENRGVDPEEGEIAPMKIWGETRGIFSPL